jgi:hypothetical protein
MAKKSKFIELIPGDFLEPFLVETFWDKSRARVRPMTGQFINPDVMISCPMWIRDEYPLGSVFRCEDPRVMLKKGEETIYIKVYNMEVVKINRGKKNSK